MPEPTTPDPNDQVVTPAEPAAPAAPEPAAAPAAAPAAGVQPDLGAVVRDAIAPLISRIDSVEGRLAAPAAPAADDLEREIQLRKDQLAAIRKGELDPSYEPEVQARLSAAVSRREGRAIVERETTRGNFVTAYNQNLQQAYVEFPELKDVNSELYKETVAILNSDPQHRRIHDALKARGRDLESVNFESFDPRINLRAAREAYAIVQRRAAARPASQPTPSLARTGLERGGATPAPAADEDLARLEAEAASSGDPNAWTRYIKARDQRLKARSQTL